MGARWYEQGLRFSCQGCLACCGGAPGYVWVTREEISLLSGHLGQSTEAFRKAYARRVDGRWSLRERDNGDCVLLGERGCLAYEARPLQCRTWPFWPENLRSEKRWLDLKACCPGVNRGRVYSAREVEELTGTLRPERKWLAGFAGLARVYQEAESWARSQGVDCRQCGACCDFEGQGHRLYASLLEAAWMLHCMRPPTEIVKNTCPYHVEGKCVNRAGRTLGCRTYFCRDVQVPEAFSYHEEALDRLKQRSSRLGLPWRYDRIDRILREAGERFQGRLFCTFSA